METEDASAASALNKVAEVTLAFWVIKICATTLGETGGDLLSMTLDVGYAASSLVLLGVFLATVALQVTARRFHPWLYWSVILSTSTAGTTMSDFLDRTLGLGYAKGSAVLIVGLAVVLACWYRVEGSVSVNRVITRRAEIFYWMAILCSNTLGTALGDFLADDSGLGFLGGACLAASVIALVAIASRWTRIDRVLLFWIAFVVTRPFGAMFGDLLTKTPEKGGLGFGAAGSSLVLLTVMVGVLAYTLRAGKGKPGESTRSAALPTENAAI